MNKLDDPYGSSHQRQASYYALHAAVTIREYIIRPVRLVNTLDDPYGLYGS